MGTDNRLAKLEKALGVSTDEMEIEIIEIWGLAEDGQTEYLMERWDLLTGEKVYYDKNGQEIKGVRKEGKTEGTG